MREGSEGETSSEREAKSSPAAGGDTPQTGRRAAQETAAADEDGSRSAAAAAERPSSARETVEQLTAAINLFYGDVHAPGSAFGAGTAKDEPTGSATGTLRAKDVEAALASYVEPAPYDSALQSLVTDRVVALTGRPGTGKRTAAISLARQVTDGPLIVLSPGATLKELADEKKRRYQAGHGYLVIDWQGESQTTDTDFRLGVVREAVAAADAHLVITSARVTGSGTPDSVHHVAWQRPELGRVVRAHGDGTTCGDDLLGAVPAEATMAGVVEFARRMAAGDTPETALEVFDIAARDDVLAWFEAGPGWQEILEVTALAFVLGVTERRFESFLADLETAMKPVVVPGESAADGAPTEDVLPQRRARRSGDGSLIRVERVTNGTSHRRVPVFKMAGHRRQVLIELWDRYEVAFWDAVKTWIDGIVAEDASRPVAQGLALFAQVDLCEVEESYLEPWSAGAHAWPGQMTAAYVLWLMCRDSLGPSALRIAVRWACQGSGAQRWTAAVAFSGELGRRYPAEAAKRLWQLIVQGDERGSEEACTALAGLYTTLVDGPGGAGVVLAMLDRQLSDALAREAKPRTRNRAVRAALAVLSATDRRTGRASVQIHLCAQPDRVDTVGRLWAGVLRHRGFRRTALQALLDGLHALRQISTRPSEDARALGESLAAALPADERDAFKKDFTTVQARSRRKADPALTRALLAALERIHLGGTS